MGCYAVFTRTQFWHNNFDIKICKKYLFAFIVCNTLFKPNKMCFCYRHTFSKSSSIWIKIRTHSYKKTHVLIFVMLKWSPFSHPGKLSSDFIFYNNTKSVSCLLLSLEQGWEAFMKSWRLCLVVVHSALMWLEALAQTFWFIFKIYCMTKYFWGTLLIRKLIKILWSNRDLKLVYMYMPKCEYVKNITESQVYHSRSV